MMTWIHKKRQLMYHRLFMNAVEVESRNESCDKEVDLMAFFYGRAGAEERSKI